MVYFSLYMSVSSKKYYFVRLDKACDIWDCTDRILLLNVSIWYLSANWIKKLFWHSQENSWKYKWLAMTPILTLLITPRSLVRSGGSALLEFSAKYINWDAQLEPDLLFLSRLNETEKFLGLMLIFLFLFDKKQFSFILSLLMWMEC